MGEFDDGFDEESLRNSIVENGVQLSRVVPHPQNVVVYEDDEQSRKERAVMTAVEQLKTKEKARREEVESKGHNSRNKTGAIKNDALKPRMSLVPQLAKIEVAKVMTYGAEKYSEYNWMDGFDWTILTDAAERHITAFNCGEDVDAESGLHHLAHAACCVMMLYEITQLHPERDNRWEHWQDEHGRKALLKALEPYAPSDYLKKFIESKKK